MPDSAPLVVIGIPTYNRPELLRRALACATRQTYPNLRVVVSDNATPGHAVADLVEGFRARFSHIDYVRQPHNIGPHGNFFFLLRAAESRYFMWLADDDEVSDDYVESLVAMLEADPAAVSAAGTWYLLQSETTGTPMRSPDLSSPNRLVRAAKFLWRGDDAFFYGLHRTDVLRQASFAGYAWPNRDSVMNWAYVFLLDMVLRGKVLQHPNPQVRFINHDYTAKTYSVGGRRLAGLLKVMLRRINVHWLYLRKAAAMCGPLFSIPLAAVSIASLLREAARSVAVRLAARLRLS